MKPSFHWFRTVFFLIPCISVYSIVLGTLSILSTFVDRRGHVAHWCARAWSWLILATTGVAVTVEGLERVQPGETYVFISNHQSIYDIPVIFASLPFQLRIIAKESLGNFPFLGWHLRRAGHLACGPQQPGSRGNPEALAAAGGRSSLADYFPGGNPKRRTVRWAKFKAGAFMLALDAGLTIVPLSISGTINVMKKGGVTTRPGRVRLVVHPPIATPKIESPTVSDARDLARRIEEVVRSGV